MHRFEHRFLAIGAAAILVACGAPTNANSNTHAPTHSDGDATHPWVMQQTSQGGDGGQVLRPPLYTASALSVRHDAAKPAATSVGVLTSVPQVKKEVFGFAFGNASLGDPIYGYPAWSLNLLTTIAYFGLSLDWDGSIIQSGSGWTTWNSSALTDMVATAHAHGVRVILSINLHDFSASPVSTICAALSPARRALTVSQTVAQVLKMGVDGVNLDYEGTNTTCAYGSTLQAEMISVTAELRAKLPKAYIAIDTYSGSAGDNSGFFNVPALSPYVDAFFVMAYDMEYYNYTGAPLYCSTFCIGPTAPLTTYRYNDTTSMSQYMTATALSKIILGVPYYGRKECVAGVTPTTAPANAKAVSGSIAADGYLDASTENGYFANTNYHAHREVRDIAGYERWDTWTSSTAKCTREMYWDDPGSLGRKYDLVNRDGIRGVGIFALQYGGGAPELWNMLQIKFVGCSAAQLTPGPGTYAVGGAISFTATATGCPTPLYEFWVKRPGASWVVARAYSTIPTFTLNTIGLAPGAYEISVWARQWGSASARYDAGAGGTYTLAGCTSVALAPAPGSYNIGETISFAATSIGCAKPEYQFWIQPPQGQWLSVQPYSTTATYNWHALKLKPGVYQVAVWARQNGSGSPRFDVGAGGPYTLSGCATAVLTPAPGASFSVGGNAAFSATSTGCVNPEYAFWVRPAGGSWVQAQAYSSLATFNWSTNGKVPGSYEVALWARQHGSVGVAYNAGAGGLYNLTGCASATLSPAPGASFRVGATVTFTAGSTGCTNPEYSFWFRPAGGTWKLMQNYSSNPIFKWYTAGLKVGSYEIVVRARQHGSGGVYDAGAGGSFSLTS